MKMVHTYGQSAVIRRGAPGNAQADHEEDMTIKVMEADAKFLRGILFALILSTIAIGAVAGYAAVQGGPVLADISQTK